MAAANDLRIGLLCFLQSREVSLGNDQHVRRRLGMDVFKGQDMFILMNFLGWNLAANDAAKQAVGVTHRGLTCGNDSTAGVSCQPASRRADQRYLVAGSANSPE